MWSPLLAIAGLAVYIMIWAVTGDDRIQCFGTITAFVALAMPFASLRQDHFGSEYYTTATWTALPGGCLDGTCIDGRWFRCKLTLELKVPCITHQPEEGNTRVSIPA